MLMYSEQDHVTVYSVIFSSIISYLLSPYHLISKSVLIFIQRSTREISLFLARVTFWLKSSSGRQKYFGLLVAIAFERLTFFLNL